LTASNVSAKGVERSGACRYQMSSLSVLSAVRLALRFERKAVGVWRRFGS
jgi:hypothetical protein